MQSSVNDSILMDPIMATGRKSKKSKKNDSESNKKILHSNLYPMPVLIVYVTHPSKPEAVQLSMKLLQERLIACVNYFPIESTYWWEGAITHSEEIVTLYKTIPEKWDELQKVIQEHHKYSVPCIIKLATVEANESYESWIASQIHIPNM